MGLAVKNIVGTATNFPSAVENCEKLTNQFLLDHPGIKLIGSVNTQLISGYGSFAVVNTLTIEYTAASLESHNPRTRLRK